MRRGLGQLTLADGLVEGGAELNRQLDAKGLMVKTGTLIDASLVRPDGRRPRTDEPVERRSDRDATWNAMPEKPLFGYKAHVAVDHGSGLVRQAILTPANVSDKTPFLALVQGDEQAVGACPQAGLRPDPGADKGYDGWWYRRGWPSAASPTASWPPTTGAGRSMPLAAPATGRSGSCGRRSSGPSQS
jgi:transposase, IS5 family